MWKQRMEKWNNMGAVSSWRGRGVLLQHLPVSGQRRTPGDLREQLQRSESQLNYHWWLRTYCCCRIGRPGLVVATSTAWSCRAGCWGCRGWGCGGHGSRTLCDQPVPQNEALQGEGVIYMDSNTDHLSLLQVPDRRNPRRRRCCRQFGVGQGRLRCPRSC